MVISSIFKMQLEQDVAKRENQKAAQKAQPNIASFLVEWPSCPGNQYNPQPLLMQESIKPKET